MPHPLPRYALPIVGRQRELADLGGLIERSQIVTLAGPGGIGKTRLAVESAARVAAGDSEGVAFADLAAIRDPQLVVETVAAVLDVEPVPGQDLLETFAAGLRSRHVLLVLDNCEHVLGCAAALVAAVTQASPDVRVLATSREPLGLPRESVYRLEPLDEDASAELFSACAQQADLRFSAAGRNVAILRDICRRLDGIPLAIQLAAACVRVMPLGQLRARLDGRLRLLAPGSAPAPVPRHQTMRALIDWSYDLLDERERVLFRRAGIFSGSFTLEALSGIVSSDDPDVGGGLDALAAKSMLVADGSRYRMLESIRQYALERLAEAGEESTMRRRFIEFFAARASAAAATFGEGSEAAWLAQYAGDLDNFRAALDWARDSDVRRAAQIAADLAEFWEFDNVPAEGLRRSEAILAAIDERDDRLLLGLLIAVGRLALAARIYRRSFEVAERARAVAERLGDAAARAEARRISGRSRYLLGIDAAPALVDLGEALAAIRTQGKAFHTARALRDYASALAQTDPEEGRRLLLEALALSQTVDWPRLTAHVEINVAEREFRSGNVPVAVERAREVIGLLRSTHSQLQLGHALTNMCSYLAVNGDGAEAIEAGREAISIGRAYDLPNYVALSIQSIALVHAGRHQPLVAARLLGYVDAFYDRFVMTRERTEAIVYERLMQKLAESVDAGAIERERRDGRQLTDDAVVALAFEPQDEPIAQEAP